MVTDKKAVIKYINVKRCQIILKRKYIQYTYVVEAFKSSEIKYNTETLKSIINKTLKMYTNNLMFNM